MSLWKKYTRVLYFSIWELIYTKVVMLLGVGKTVWRFYDLDGSHES